MSTATIVIMSGAVVMALFGALLRLFPSWSRGQRDWLYEWRVKPRYAVVCMAATGGYAVGAMVLIGHFAHPDNWGERFFVALVILLTSLVYHETLYKKPGWWRHYKYTKVSDLD